MTLIYTVGHAHTMHHSAITTLQQTCVNTLNIIHYEQTLLYKREMHDKNYVHKAQYTFEQKLHTNYEQHKSQTVYTNCFERQFNIDIP